MRLRAFFHARDTLANRALLVLLIASAANLGTVLLLAWLTETNEDWLAPEAFQPWASPGLLVAFCAASVLVAAYIYLSAPYQPRRAVRYLALPTGPVDLSRLRPGGTIDPFALYQGYGESQARSILGSEGLDEITKSAAIVERHKPGTMPKGRKTKKLLVDYIMAQVMDG